MKLRALKSFEKIIDGSIGRPRKNGEIFEVDQKRAELLLSHKLVEIVPELKAEEPPVTPMVEEKQEEPKKKRTRKTKK